MANIPSRLMTAEAFYDWSHLDENRDRNFELEAGIVVELPLTDQRRGLVCGNLCYILWTYLRANRTGYVCSNNVGLILERNPDTVRGPDIAVFLQKRKFEDLEIEYVERMPTLAVEVLSRRDYMGKMLKRINKFLEKGVAMVWLLDPELQSVYVFLPDHLPIVLEGDEEVTGQDVLPDFRCKASEFFVTG